MTRRRIEPPSIGAIFRPETPLGCTTTRGPKVFVMLHEDCARCLTWARQELGEVRDEIARWGGRIVRLDGDDRADDPEAAWLAVVDEWGEVFEVVRFGADHGFPAPSGVVEWTRFVAIQCPECEGPEGPWRQ